MRTKILRAVLVTNHAHPTEGVVLAVEAYPWHTTLEESEACTDEWCKKHHQVFVLGHMEFNFDLRCVYPVGDPNYGCPETHTGPIPNEELSRFNADFGLYYAS